MLGNGLYSSVQISFKEAKPTTVSEEFNVTLKTYPPDLCPKRSCLMDATYYLLPYSIPLSSTDTVCSLSRQRVKFLSGRSWCFPFIFKVLGKVTSVQHQQHLRTHDLIEIVEAGSKASVW